MFHLRQFMSNFFGEEIPKTEASGPFHRTVPEECVPSKKI